MAGDVRRSLRVGGTFARVAVLHELQYRVNFFLQLVQSAIAVGTALAVLALVFRYTGDLGGWTRDELLVVLGVHVGVGGLVQTLVQPNMLRLMEEVQAGTLDFALLKPVDTQVLVSVRELRIWNLTDVLVGAALVLTGVVRSGGTTVAGAIAFLVTLPLGALLVYCTWLAITVGSFWLIRMDFVVDLFEGLYQAGRWPVSIYPGWLRVGFTVLVPLAFAVTVPAEALTGRLTPLTAAVALGFCGLALAATRWWWRFGVRHYAGASA
jgi:ABC-2 type transport system permease protein